MVQGSDESRPLLPTSSGRKRSRTHWWKRAPSPTWMIPCALLAATARAITLAPRTHVFNELACLSLDSSTTIGIAVNCASNPYAQSRAATLQTTLTLTSGILSAVSSSFYSSFSSTSPILTRTRLLALSAFGLLLLDLTFLSLSLSSGVDNTHPARWFLYIAPALEGALGGWATLQSSVSSYVADLTLPGSRSKAFSRITAAFFIGIAVGPALGADLGPWVTRRIPISRTESGNGGNGLADVRGAFALAVACWTILITLALFVIPSPPVHSSNSTSPRRTLTWTQTLSPLRILRPLRIFLPYTPSSSSTSNSLNNNKSKKGTTTDYSLPALSASLLLHFLTSSPGLYQVKYLYASSPYGYSWGVRELGWYVCLLGACRAVSTGLGVPAVIWLYKKTHPRPTPKKGQQKTKKDLTHDLNQDLFLARTSLSADHLSNSLIFLFPILRAFFVSNAVPSYPAHTSMAGGRGGGTPAALFVLFSLPSAMGSGAVPAVQSLMLCVLHARRDAWFAANSRPSNGAVTENDGAGASATAAVTAAVTAAAPGTSGAGTGSRRGTRGEQEDADFLPEEEELLVGELRQRSNSELEETEPRPWLGPDSGTGALLGALATLQAVSSFVLGPLVFGGLYAWSMSPRSPPRSSPDPSYPSPGPSPGESAPKYPRAVFGVAALVILGSLVGVGVVRPRRRRAPSRVVKGGSYRRRRSGDGEEGEEGRGRRRERKDLRGGAAGHHDGLGVGVGDA